MDFKKNTFDKSIFVDRHNFNTGIIVKKDDIYTNIVENLDEKTQFMLVYRSAFDRLNWNILHTKTENYFQKKDKEIHYQLEENNNRFSDGGECWQDSRFVVIDNILYVFYSIVYDFYDFPSVKQAITPIDDNKKQIFFTGFPVNLFEKNWSIFQLKETGKIYLVYSFLPRYVLYEVEKETFHCTLLKDNTYNDQPTVRGGCMPIEIDDKLYFFGHTLGPHKLALTIVDKKTLNVVGYLLDCLPDKNMFNGTIYYCRGALYVVSEDLFIISCGVDDIDTQILHIPKKYVDANIRGVGDEIVSDPLKN